MVIKIGHRGAMGYEEGNTIKSFKKAVFLGVDMVDLEVHFKDGKLYVLHDINRWKIGTPSLAQVIEVVNRRAKINIELKGENTAKPVAELIKKYVSLGWTYEDFLISSLKFEELEHFRKLCAEVKIAVLIRREGGEYLEIAKKLKAYAINVSIDAIQKDGKIVKRLHELGYKVFVWTVNSPKKIKRLINELEVDGICSDFPDRI